MPGVGSDGVVEPLELPRVVDNRTTDEATAIRFQASAQGVADKSFGLNHSKNYLGYPLAHYADGDTDQLLRHHHIVGQSRTHGGVRHFLDSSRRFRTVSNSRQLVWR